MSGLNVIHIDTCEWPDVQIARVQLYRCVSSRCKLMTIIEDYITTRNRYNIKTRYTEWHTENNRQPNRDKSRVTCVGVLHFHW